jgi:hypothetical protein
MKSARPANDNRFPKDIITVEQLTALLDSGWIVVRHDAIRLAQSHAVDEVRAKIERSAANA